MASEPQKIIRDEHEGAICSFCFATKENVFVLVYVRDRYYICDQCVEAAQEAVEQYWNKVYADRGAIEYDSWGQT